ncbi:hypothetical protein [Paracoccus tegillarcae]|uniref:Uncharacterized protein n=1 Tax=Paracoccus tegillarcae TaxID=1529068 RepID=A0A2K9EU16_9RHOB|nr:hypothetical protein [Paracoccus tegillarcae]AUH32714.1 hypothetical protein CUV01_04345 [Paracoccus tegillarcae]
MNGKFLAIAVAATALTACSLNPRDYETTPVVVETAAGPVTCQLYTKEQVTWDRATARPNSMDVETADNVCRAEGQRELTGGASAAPAI